MITGMHSIVYASDADAARAFFRDVLGLPWVDAHDGWLIFRQPPSELAVHPVNGPERHARALPDVRRHRADHGRADRQGREFSGPVTQASFGLMTSVVIPGGGTIGLYEPRHRTAYDL